MMLQIDGYKMKEGHYTQNDAAVTDFILDVVTIITQGTEKFKFLVYRESGNYEIIVTLAQLKGKRFFNDIPVSIHAEKEAQFYASLRKAILNRQFTVEEMIYETGKNGLQEVYGETMFVFTNGSISQSGFHPHIYSGIGGAYIPEEAVLGSGETNEITEKLFWQYNRNAEVFYPLFLYNIMSITNKYFRDIGEQAFMKLTLWIGGVSGSGKTELAKCAGNYVFCDADFNRELVSATCRRKYALTRLSQSSGTTFILDDVKKEAVWERKNSVKNILDDCIRSVFKGGLTDVLSGQENEIKKVDACAIITGEFMETEESLNARLFYLKVDGFLKKKANSESLRALQEHPLWLSAVCCGYIQWLLKKIKESSFKEFVKAELRGLRAQKIMYAEMNNAERLNENRYMLEMAAVLAGMYFRETGISENFLMRFQKKAGQAIKKINEDTYCLLGGAQMAFLKILSNLFSKSQIRKAVYRRGYNGWKYCQIEFCIWKEDDFVWIDDYEESLKKDRADRYNTNTQGAFLLIREKRFMELFQSEIQNLLKEGEISSDITDKLQTDGKKMLREMQIIFKRRRTENGWGRASVEYPVFTYQERETHYEEHDYEEDCYFESRTYTECMLEKEPVMQMNISHPCVRILEERVGQMEEECVFNAPENWEMSGMKLSEIWEMRKSFANGKELYRK